MDMRSTLRRTEFGQRVLAARTHAQMTQHTLAKAAGMSQGTLGETEKQALSSTFTAQIAKATGVNAYWLATGKGQMLEGPARFDKDQTDVAKGPELMRTALNILAICLHDMDADSRTEAGYLMQKMAENPGGRWSGRLGDMIEKEAEPYLWEAICNSDRAGKYPLSIRNDPPRMSSKSGSAQTEAIKRSNQPTGDDDASLGEDRNKDQNRGSHGVAGSG